MPARSCRRSTTPSPTPSSTCCSAEISPSSCAKERPAARSRCAVVQAIDDAKPDAIFNVLFGGDLAKLVREGTTRGTFKNRTVVSLLSGEPEYLDPLKDEAPVGWIVTGYPWDAINTPAHKGFRDVYRKRWNDYPRLGSGAGCDTLNSLAAGIAMAGSRDTC